MKHQHTPGPWSASFADDASMSDGYAGWVIDSARRIGCLAVVRGSGTADKPNALLIASAPQMFDTLARVKEILSHNDEGADDYYSAADVVDALLELIGEPAEPFKYEAEAESERRAELDFERRS